MSKKQILLLYHSGSGSTKTICEIIKTKIDNSYDVKLLDILNFNHNQIAPFDFLIIGFPTYHTSPPQTIMEIITKIPQLQNQKNALVFTTKGLYSGNSLKMIINKLLEKNIITIGFTEIKGPSSDGVLFFPSWIKYMFNYEKSTLKKISYLTSKINIQPQTKAKAPCYKWYTPLNPIVEKLGKKLFNIFKKQLTNTPSKCLFCQKCVQECLKKCWTVNKQQNTLQFNFANCEFCLKCIHNCPTKAIEIGSLTLNMPRLNKRFYNNQKEKLLKKG